MSLSAAHQHVVAMHYTLTNDAGEVLDSSQGREPLAYLHGAGNIVPGLEKAISGRKAGDKFSVSVAPAEGYGEHDPERVQDVPRSAFQGVDDIQPGMQFQAGNGRGQGMPVVVTKVDSQTVTIDANHPLAGVTLHFAIEITEVRAATAQELAHGHVHAHGHDH